MDPASPNPAFVATAAHAVPKHISDNLRLMALPADLPGEDTCPWCGELEGGAFCCRYRPRLRDVEGGPEALAREARHGRTVFGLRPDEEQRLAALDEADTVDRYAALPGGAP